MRSTADVVVIGGGVMGCSILFNLARLGITNTVLLEKDILNGGSTGRSQSICRMHYSNPVTATMAWESLKVFTNFEDVVGGPSGFTETGYLVVVKEEDRPGLEHNCAMQVGLGIDTMVVTAADLADIAPMVAVTEDEAMGWEPQSGYADPYLVTSSYANAARTLGQRSTSAFRPLASKSWTDEYGQSTRRREASRRPPWWSPLARGQRVSWRRWGIDVPLVTVRHQVASLARPVDRLPLHPAVGDIAQSFSFRPDGPRMTLMGFGDDEERTLRPTTSYRVSTTWPWPRRSS